MTLGDDYRYRVARSADRAADQAREIEVAAAVAPVDDVDVPKLVLGHPQLTVTQLAHLKLRIVQPPGIFTSTRARVGLMSIGPHPAAVAALLPWSRLGEVIARLAATWTGTMAELATNASTRSRSA